jgi:hypothetical protein
MIQITIACVLIGILAALLLTIIMCIVIVGARADRTKEAALFQMQHAGYSLKWNDHTQTFDVIKPDGTQL